MSRIKPLLKSGDKSLFSNYSPISLLPSLSKILDQLLGYFTNNLLCLDQFDFRPDHSTQLAALRLVDHLITQMVRCKIPTNIYIYRGVCRISQGGGPTLKFLGFWIYMPRSGMSRAAKLRALARGVWGHAPPRKFLKMVQFRAF